MSNTSEDPTLEAKPMSTNETCDLCGDDAARPTGWASETNPGTGGGTGRDEMIAYPCPRGCPDPDELAREALRDPYTTIPGAFTAARERGWVELHEGQPRVSPLGACQLALDATAITGLLDDHGEDPRW